MKEPTKKNLVEQIRILDELCMLAKQSTLLAQSENRVLRNDIEQLVRELDASLIDVERWQMAIKCGHVTVEAIDAAIAGEKNHG